MVKPIGERIVEWLGGATKRSVAESANRAYESGFYDGMEGNDDPSSGDVARGGFGYRTAGGQGLQPAISAEDGLRTAWALWQSNPVARRTNRIKRDYIIKRGLTPATQDDALGKIVDGFWSDNRLDTRAAQFAAQLFAFGEQCFPVFVRRSDGHVTLGYFGPEQIERVIKHPDNALEDWAVVIKAENVTADAWRASHDRRVYRVVRKAEPVVVEAGKRETLAVQRHGALECQHCGALNYREALECRTCRAPLYRDVAEARTIEAVYERPGADGGATRAINVKGMLVTAEQAPLEPWEARMLQAHGLSEYSGSCFYVKVNAVSNQERGQSDLLPLADWLDQLDEVLFALAEREQFAGFFSYDVALETADAETVKQRAREIRMNPPKRGSVNVHNQAEEWRLDAPDLKQGGSIESYKALLTHTLGGAGLPQSWYGYGDETNRATAQAQADPTWRSMEFDQGVVRDMLVAFCEFARDQAIISGRYAPSDSTDQSIDVPMPEMTTRDVGRIASALVAIVNGLMVAVELKLMPKPDAVAVLYKVLDELGLDLEAPEEDELPDEELGDADAAPMQSDNLEAWRRVIAEMAVVVE